LIEVELGDLKKVGKELAEALAQRLKTDVSVKGKTLVVEDPAGSKVSVTAVKLQVKHALHQLGFSEEYRVLTDQHKVRISKVEEKIRYAERGGKAPPPAKSLPYLFPG